jgi:hypothetical protein
MFLVMAGICVHADNGPVIFNIEVADLPNPCAPDRPYWVSDGNDSEDCTLGGGSSQVICTCDAAGTGYTALSAGGATVYGDPVILDLEDDDANESDGLVELATSGDTNSIFSEPTADKLLIDVSQNWVQSDSAVALAADGANCDPGEIPLGVDTQGAVQGCYTDSNASTICSALESLRGDGTCVLPWDFGARAALAACPPAQDQLRVDADGDLCFCDGTSWALVSGSGTCVEAGASFLLAETGDYVLLESGDKIVLES